MTPEMQAFVTLTNLTKTRTPDNNSLPVTSSPAAFQTSGVWTQATGSLRVRITAPISIGQLYTVRFVLSNPIQGQQSPSISISFQGVDTATGEDVIIIPFLPVYPALDNSAPLLIGIFNLAYVEQQTSSSTLSNRISVTFSTTVRLVMHTTISIYNLKGSMGEMGTIRGISSTSSMVNQVVLDSSASSVDNAYLGHAINIKGIFSNITQYSGDSKLATLSPPIPFLPNVGYDYYYIATNFSQSIFIACDGLVGCDYGLTSGSMNMVRLKLFQKSASSNLLFIHLNRCKESLLYSWAPQLRPTRPTSSHLHYVTVLLGSTHHRCRYPP
jgi:hypothetical protein